MSPGDWYLALVSIGVGVSLPAYWLLSGERTDRFHLASEVTTGLVLLVAGIAMLAADPDNAWVVAASSIGLGMLAYALIDSPGRYRGDRHKLVQFATGWVFLLPALVIRLVTR